MFPVYTDRAVQAEGEQHHEEEDGPERGERHGGDGLGVDYEHQTRTWRGTGRRVTYVTCLSLVLYKQRAPDPY